MNPQGWPAGSYFGESLEYGGKSSVTQEPVERNGQFGWRRGSASLAASARFARLEVPPAWTIPLIHPAPEARHNLAQRVSTGYPVPLKTHSLR